MIRGLYGIADAHNGDPLETASAMLAGGCRLVQLRAKSWTIDDVERVGKQFVALCRRVGAIAIINDYAEIAVATGAHGVHVGREDPATVVIRAIVGPDLLIGRSTNDLADVSGAEKGADYLAFGPIWETRNVSRPKAIQGVDRLRSVRALTRLPLVAIGGITRERLPKIRRLADAWAVIGAISSEADPVAATKGLL